MITKDNIKELLAALKFNQEGNIFTKHFAQGDFDLKIDFDKSLIIYPENKGFIVNERQTCNLSSNENFVVFECVHRLLEKGYKPQHIELEPKWKLGHGASGGRADIFVKNQQDKPLLIIECKTAGKEFERAWKDTLIDGGQLFSYIEQEKDIEFVCLYASSPPAPSGEEIIIEQRIISHRDNEQILTENPKLKGFKQAKNVKERYKVWKETYQLEYTEKGIFEENILPYQIGKDKYTLDIDTKPISSLDIKGKYHEFRTILRKYNVSRRENAFEVLVNLFLCKLVDEIENPNELKFYWKGIAYDNYFDLVDRLQELYKTGMDKFLHQEITYISNKEIDDAFWAIKQKNNITKKHIKEIFRTLKFFNDNSFGFIGVKNKESFDKNAKILLEILQMWQGLRLKTKEQNQFLGDMFEYFLDNGIKQSEGQFFTPVPICKFVVMAMPLEEQITHSNEPLRAIDYACGSGHFLTEYALQVKPLVKQYKNAEPQSYFKQIYGIEKEDRLAKVAKVSAFMYGMDDINVIDADALATLPEIKNGTFDVLVANPPFAVEDFLMTLSEEDREKYELLETANDLGNKNIQCFFLERAKQLLKHGGTMGVIVPSSVLSNSDTMHVATREILLQYFDFVSIVELGSGTFGKTGTNTVVLFLRRKKHLPEPAEVYRARVENFFENWDEELNSGGGAYLDINIVKQYCQHIEIDFEDYQNLLRNTPLAIGEGQGLMTYEMFKDYKADFDALTDTKKLKENRTFKAKTPAEQKAELEKRFLSYLQAIEKEKLFYFMLAKNNSSDKVLLVKSPADNKEQKTFLGYEWSGAKGNEGIKYNGGETIYDIITPMFDPKNRQNPDKIAYWIQQNFAPKTANATVETLHATSLPIPTATPTQIPDHLQPFCTYAPLTDLLDFSRKDFNKAFSLSPKKNLSIETKWEQVRLEVVSEIVRGVTYAKADEVAERTENIVLTSDNITLSGRFELNKQVFVANTVKFDDSKRLKRGDIFMCFASGSLNHLGKVAFIQNDTNYYAGGFMGIIRAIRNKILPKYLFEIFNSPVFRDIIRGEGSGSNINNLSSSINQLKIPLPPLPVQEQIVAECEVIDQASTQAQEIIKKTKKEIEELVNEVFSKGYKIEKLIEVTSKIGSGATPLGGESAYKTEGITLIRSQNIYDEGFYTKGLAFIDEEQASKLNNVIVEENDVLFNITGASVARCCLAEKKYLPARVNQHVAIIRPTNRVKSHYLKQILTSQNAKNELLQLAGNSATREAITKSQLENYKIPVPPLAEQERLVAEIVVLEKLITDNQQIIANSPAQKQAVMKRYL